MDVKKVIIRTVVFLVFGLMLTTAIIFLLASSVPSHYTPMQMTKKQREDAAAKLVQRSIELLNNYQKPEPFTHVIREEELNRYLSSLEEIAHLRLPRKGKEDVR